MTKRLAHADCGQMTVELAAALPALIVVAVIAVNACTFFHECAVFDRVVNGTVRACAASPSYGQGPGQACAAVEQALVANLDTGNIEVSVVHSTVGADFDEYCATLVFHPTLFGASLRSDVFGVSLPALTHTTRYVVDSYRAGVLV